MRVGFTGTRKGMSTAQKRQFAWLMLRLRPVSFHVGGAAGADTEAWAFVAANRGVEMHAHPTFGVVRSEEDYRDFPQHVWHEVLPPLVRNRHIVDACDLLVAAPETDKEQQRSGTWATVRYARKAGKPVVMLSRGE